MGNKHRIQYDFGQRDWEGYELLMKRTEATIHSVLHGHLVRAGLLLSDPSIKDAEIIARHPDGTEVRLMFLGLRHR